MSSKRNLALNTEYPEPDEDELPGKIGAILQEVLKGRFLQGMTYRGVNTKSHAAVRAELVVDPALPSELRIGVFRDPGRRYPAWIRFSSTLPESLPDKVPDLRGMGLKIMGVEGPKLLPGDEDGTNHDFLFITPDTFLTRTATQFFEFAATGAMKAHRTPGDFWKMLVFLVRDPRVGINLLRNQTRIASLLETGWNSSTPYLFGNRAVKYGLAPRQPAKSKIPSNPSNNYLREALIRDLREAGAAFDFRIQFQLDPHKQPIEDALVAWKESDSPWHQLGTLVLPQQMIDSPEQMLFCEHISMNPWRCLAEHRPLGGVNRIRRSLYLEGAKFRHTRNAVTVPEPEAGSAGQPGESVHEQRARTAYASKPDERMNS
jgi:hypothetical protein